MLLSVLLVSSIVNANCDAMYPYNKKVKTQYDELCNLEYVVIYDSKMRIPRYTSYHLYPGDKQISRNYSFLKDKRVDRGITSNLYTNSGYDRGHLVPAADMKSPLSVKETFLMTNIVPQTRYANRIVIKGIEDKIRKDVEESNEDVYIVTIPIYKKYNIINGIYVPDEIIKIVYKNKKRTIYKISNSNSGTYKILKYFNISKIL